MQINIKNLIIARDGLLGLDPEAFDMQAFRRESKDGRSTEFFSKDDCGTVGCALGWCPFIPGLEAKKSDFSYQYISFAKYSERVLGIEDGSLVWEYMFGSHWVNKNNTVGGLIRRMTDVIEGKKVLSNTIEVEAF